MSARCLEPTRVRDKDKILIVDDDKDFADSLACMLSGHDFDTAVANNCDVACDMIRGFDAQVALLDVRLRDRSGVDLIGDLCRIRPDLRCVMMTAHAEVDSAIAAVKQGAFDYLRKPLDEMVLFATMDRCLELSHLQRQKQEAEHRLAHLQALLENIVDSMPSILVAVDGSYRVTQWNEEARRVSGIDVCDAIGCSFGDLLPQFREQIAAARTSIREGQVHKDLRVPGDIGGDPRMFDVTVYPLKEVELDGAVVRIDDVTDRSHMEEVVVQTEKMMSVGGLAAGMAHEINNPLGGMMQAAQNILRRVSPGLPKNQQVATECGTSIEAIGEYMSRREVMKFLEGIRECGERAGEIVSGMLAFCRKSKAHICKADICQLLDRAVEMAATDFDLERSFDLRHIELERHYAEGLPQVLAVATEIEQVFLNLLRNSAHAMSANRGVAGPKIVLRVSREEGYVVAEIEDNGSGMPEEVRRRVFEPFFTTKPVGTGTGLGLSVSYMIVTQNHGGTMTVDSTPGKGTKFAVSLPIDGGKLA